VPVTTANNSTTPILVLINGIPIVLDQRSAFQDDRQSPSDRRSGGVAPDEKIVSIAEISDALPTTRSFIGLLIRIIK